MNKKLLFVLVIGVIMTLPIGSTGTPDYGKSLASNPTVQSYDSGEDTTRLLMGGGANSRGGRWIWATGFESGLAEMGVSFSGVNVAPSISTANAYMGKQSLFMTTTAAGVLSWQKKLFSPILPGATNNKFAIEAMVSFQNNGRPFTFLWYVDAPFPDDITKRGTYAIQLVDNGAGLRKLKFFSPNVDIPGGDVSGYIVNDSKLFHYTKFVFDIKEHTLIRFTFDNIVLDLNNQPAPTGVGNRYFDCQLNLYEAGSFPLIAHIDNVIITGDEP